MTVFLFAVIFIMIFLYNINFDIPGFVASPEAKEEDKQAVVYRRMDYKSYLCIINSGF